MITRMTKTSDTEFESAEAALLAFAQDVAAGMARDGAPRITFNPDSLVLRYSDDSTVRYLGDFQQLPYGITER